jgi:hypothetical protein
MKSAMGWTVAARRLVSQSVSSWLRVAALRMVGREEGQSTMAGAYPPLTALGRALAMSRRALSRIGMELAAVNEREVAEARHATRCVEVGAMM